MQFNAKGNTMHCIGLMYYSPALSKATSQCWSKLWCSTVHRNAKCLVCYNVLQCNFKPNPPLAAPLKADPADFCAASNCMGCNALASKRLEWSMEHCSSLVLQYGAVQCSGWCWCWIGKQRGASWIRGSIVSYLRPHWVIVTVFIVIIIILKLCYTRCHHDCHSCK